MPAITFDENLSKDLHFVLGICGLRGILSSKHRHDFGRMCLHGSPNSPKVIQYTTLSHLLNPSRLSSNLRSVSEQADFSQSHEGSVAHESS